MNNDGVVEFSLVFCICLKQTKEGSCGESAAGALDKPLTVQFLNCSPTGSLRYRESLVNILYYIWSYSRNVTKIE